MTEKKIKHTRYVLGDWRTETRESWWAWVYVGGSLDEAEMVCRRFCLEEGLCVTIRKCHYIFPGGSEYGVQIGLIQYPPFTTDEATLNDLALRIGQAIAEANGQWSYTVVTKDKCIFRSRRNK